MYFITPAFSGIFGLMVLVTWLILAIIAFVDLSRTRWLNAANRILWVVVIIIIPILGALVYLFWKKVKQVEN